MRKNIVTSTTTFQVEGARNASNERRIDALEQQAQANTAVNLNSPEICTGGFVVGYEKIKAKFRATFCVEVPEGTIELTTKIIRVADVTDATSYKKNRIADTYAVEDGRTHLEYRFAPRIEPGTAYRLIRLIAWDQNGNATAFPQSEQAWDASVPAAMLFTTPGALNAPSDPSLALIKKNQEDTNTRELDALVEAWVWAPLTETNTAQTWAQWAASGGDELVPMFTRTDFTPAERVQIAPIKIRSTDTEVDPASTPVPNRGLMKVLLEGLRYGSPYSWDRNRVWQNGEHADSTGPAVAFRAGNAQIDPNALSGVSLEVITSAPFDAKHRGANLLFTQPAIIVALKHVTVRVKLQSDPDSVYDLPESTQIKKATLRDTEWHTAGFHRAFIGKLKLKPTLAYTLQVQITAIGFAQRIFTVNVGASTDPDVPNDTGVPDGLQQPSLKYIPGVGLKIEGMKATLSNNTENDTFTVVYNGGGLYLDIPTLISSNGETVQIATEALARHGVGGYAKKDTIEVPLEGLQAIFGTSATLFAYYYKQNAIGLSLKSVDSSGLPFTSIRDTKNAKRSAKKVSAGVIPPGQQMLPNADLCIESPALTLDRWFAWDGSTTPLTAGGNVSITTASSNLRYIRSGHCARFLDTTKHLNCNLRKQQIQRAEKFSVGFLARANTFLPNMSFRIYVRAVDNGQNQIVTNFLLGGPFIVIDLPNLDTTYREYGGIFQIDDLARLDDGAATISQFLLFQLVGSLGVNQVDFFRPVLGRGADPPKWSIRPDDLGLMDAIITEVVQTPEVVRSVGVYGGGFDGPGAGGAITRYGEAVSA